MRKLTQTLALLVLTLSLLLVDRLGNSRIAR